MFVFLRRGHESIDLADEPEHDDWQEEQEVDHHHVAEVERLDDDLRLGTPSEQVAQTACAQSGDVAAEVLKLIQQCGVPEEQQTEKAPAEDARQERQRAFAGHTSDKPEKFEKVLHLVPPNVA